LTLRWIDGEGELGGALALRERVFCDEQGVPPAEERDGLDAEATHLLALAGDDELVGTLRVVRVRRQAKIGRVAVKRSWRRRGVASAMLDEALARAARDGARQVRLAAQTDAIELYTCAGFEIESDRFVEAGIEHVWMGRALEPPRQTGPRRH
jgi:predicted GNAT family N-acyltransferase